MLGLHHRLGGPEQRRSPLVLLPLGGDRGESGDREWLRELVADASADDQRLAIQLRGGLEVPELTLDHAEVGRLGGHEEVVAERADQRQALGHPAPRLGQVAGDLGADSEQMKGVRASGFVPGRLAHLERLMREPPAFGHVSPQRHPAESTERLRDHGRVVQPTGELERPAEERPGPIVVPHPERHEAGVEVRPSPKPVVAGARLEDLAKRDRPPRTVA